MNSAVMVPLFRSVRSVPKGDIDKLASDEKVEQQIRHFFSALQHIDVKLEDIFQHEDLQSKRRTPPDQTHLNEPRVEIEILLKRQYGDKDVSTKHLDVMFDVMGFCIERRKSTIPDGGRGVVVTRGQIPKGSVAAMYPGKKLQTDLS